MGSEERKSDDYQQIDPENYTDYEDRYLETGGGGKSSGSGKGKKTLKAIKSQVKKASEERANKTLSEKLVRFLNSVTGRDESAYADWVNQNLRGGFKLDPAKIEISFARSGGPGGQNVNKRETKVIVLHKLTGMQTSSEQTRSQLENRQLALAELENRLKEHLDDWRAYLPAGGELTPELIREIVKENPD